MEKKNLIAELSFEFAVEIIQLSQSLIYEKNYIIAKQVLRSGTSIGANIEESTAAISKKEFIAKMSISSKEARETRYWLRLLRESTITKIDVHDLLSKIEKIIRIITKIIITASKNQNNSKL
ncbi:MAG: four helix bundle protein [Chitinophagales bacterium]|nr:four helix bundle protein [Chitinophagales bacterium]